MTHHAERTVIETYEGWYVDFADPDPSTITLVDIAWPLAFTCRFGGHVARYWSVADHALLVRDLVCDLGHPELALAALHHDSHEAYVGDLPTPLKNFAGAAVKETANRLDAAIATAMGVEVEQFYAEPVRKADELALRIEAFHLKVSRGISGAWKFREAPPIMRPLPRRGFNQSALIFMEAHRNLGGTT